MYTIVDFDWSENMTLHDVKFSTAAPLLTPVPFSSLPARCDCKGKIYLWSFQAGVGGGACCVYCDGFS